MFPRLFARARRNESIAYSLYGTIVAQSRKPVLYTRFQVPDTLDGRFDMIVLHAFLLLHRLKSAEAPDRQIGQGVFDLFLKDMDRNLREMGVGDVGVPKKLKKMAESFYGRVQAYDAALTAGDETALAEAIARNVFPDIPAGEGPEWLATYAFAASAALSGQPVEAIARGEITFPEPESALSQVAA